MNESANPDALATEVPALQSEVMALRQQLAAAQAGLSDFAYTVSHDLRANLRHISAYADILREEQAAALGEEGGMYLETIAKAARQMGQQIDGLMQWSQLDRAEMQVSALDLRFLIAEARQAVLSQTPGAASHAIAWAVADDFPAVLGDAVLLRQLFVHLLSNAIKFTRPRSQAEIRLGWQPAAQADCCTVFVRDNGVGFNPRLQHKLFHVFQRLHGSEFEGQGLGLALAAKIVARHGGQIEAEGDANAGCCIRLTLKKAAAGS